MSIVVSSFHATVMWEKHGGTLDTCSGILGSVCNAHSYYLDTVTMVLPSISVLEEWSRFITSGYPGVIINSIPGSWTSGLALCAIIARFRPDLLEYDDLEKTDDYKHCNLAFHIGEKYLDIPSLLHHQDMVETRQLDKLTIITFLAKLYHKFSEKVPKPAPRIFLNKEDENVRMGDMSSTDSGVESSSGQSSPIFSKTSEVLFSDHEDSESHTIHKLSNYKSNHIQDIKPRVKVASFQTDDYYQSSKNTRGKPKNIPTMRCDHKQVVSYHKYNQLQGKEKRSSQSCCESTYIWQNQEFQRKFPNSSFTLDNRKTEVDIMDHLKERKVAQKDEERKTTNNQFTQTTSYLKYLNNIDTASSSSISSLYTRCKGSERVKNNYKRGSDIINYKDMKKISNISEDNQRQALLRSNNGYRHSLEYSYRNIPQTCAGNYQANNKLSTLV